VATNVAKRLASLSKRLSDFDRIVVTTAGQIIADSVMEQLARDTSGGMMRNVGKNGVRLDVQITPLSNPTGVRIRPRGKTSGPWTMLSTGTSAHLVAARRKRLKGRGNASRARSMRVGGAWRTGPWTVGGSRGKGTWQKGRETGLDEAVKAVADEFKKVVAG
jgi:hypothetical protein